MVAGIVTSLQENKCILRRRRFVALISAMVVASIFGMSLSVAEAQTPDATCASDSLYLISPDELDLSLNLTGKPGLTISWPNLDLTDATCFSLTGTEDLNFNVSSSGGFGDKVDRLIKFSTPDAGIIGGAAPDNIILSWQNQGDGANGNLGGIINLSNNGGLWEYRVLGGGQWAQTNNGLPMSWQRTNIVAMDVGSGDFKVAAFTSGASFDSTPAGIYKFDGIEWARIAPEIFTDKILVTKIVVSPSDNDAFAVGTSLDGLFITDDGGASFTQDRKSVV